MSTNHNELSRQHISLLETQLCQLQRLATQSNMHTSYLSAAVASLMLLSASAAPAPVSSSSSSQSPTIQQAHLPGSPHAPTLHPTTSASPSTSSSSSPPSRSSAQKRNQDLHNLKDLVLEIRDDGNNDDWLPTTSRSQNTGNGGDGKADDGGEDHATYMLGSPVSFPARGGGQGGRNVA